MMNKVSLMSPVDALTRRLHMMLTRVALSAILMACFPAMAQTLDPSNAAPVMEDPAATAVFEQSSQRRSADGSVLPYGANLFSGGFSNDREDGLNPDYVLQPGDRVSVRIWGAIEFNESLVLDPQGNIFLPSVGPIALAGTQNRNLNERVRQAVSTVFTDNVRVYTSLDGSQPVAVFVTGAVEQPGRFAGIPSNSVLHFIDRAGGIDADRGSYRDIRILRAGSVLATVDLYDFLQNGQLKQVQFQDGDTVLVAPRGPSVEVTGEVGNAARFELTPGGFTGADIAALARLQPGVTHAGLSGTRAGEMWSVYLPVEEFMQQALSNGDTVSFRSDQRERVIVVEVEGSYIGPSRYALPQDARLQELLDLIEVDPVLADISSISIRRPSIAARQKEALRESLQRLEARYLTANSQTDGEAAIRAQEAELIGRFVASAKSVEPSGRLVVAQGEGVANVQLQAGDVITIPRHSESVLLSGEVLVSQAILAQPGLRARDYIAAAGGFAEQALEKRVVVVHANGEVESGENPRVRAGDEIIVLPKVPVKNLQIAATIVDILYKVAIAASVALAL